MKNNAEPRACRPRRRGEEHVVSSLSSCLRPRAPPEHPGEKPCPIGSPRSQHSCGVAGPGGPRWWPGWWPGGPRAAPAPSEAEPFRGGGCFLQGGQGRALPSPTIERLSLPPSVQTAPALGTQMPTTARPGGWVHLWRRGQWLFCKERSLRWQQGPRPESGNSASCPGPR